MDAIGKMRMYVAAAEEFGIDQGGWSKNMAIAQAYAAIVQAEQLKRIADALYVDMYDGYRRVGQVSRIGM